MTVRLLSPSPIVVCSVYVPPSQDDSAHSFLLSYLYDLFSSSSDIVIVTGDFNCPDISWDLFLSSSSFSAQLCDFLLDFCLAQLVDAPTHTKGDILDLIITNSPDYIQNLCIERTLFSISLSVLQFYQFFHTCDLQVQSSLTILKLILMEWVIFSWTGTSPLS